MAHTGKNKGPGWIGTRGDNQIDFTLRVKRRKKRSKIAKAARKKNRRK